MLHNFDAHFRVAKLRLHACWHMLHVHTHVPVTAHSHPHVHALSGRGSLDEECSKFMRPGVRPAKSTRSGSMRIDTLSQRSTLNIQRLFTDKIEIYDTVQSTTISVTSGIIKIALKAMLESVRLKTFSSYGLQQIQGQIFSFTSFFLLSIQLTYRVCIIFSGDTVRMKVI